MQATHPYSNFEIWSRWTVAMTIGEFVGFAVPAAVGAIAGSMLQSAAKPFGDLALAGIMILAGMVEGSVLGWSQWIALRRYVPAIKARDWSVVTALGAMVAWGIGMLPGTLGDPTQLNPAVLIAGAALLGPILLCSLGFAQWLVLKRHLVRAGWWIPSSALAWLFGLAVVFAGMSLSNEGDSVVSIATVAAFSGLLMGATVAAISGLAVVWMLRSQPARKVEQP